MIVGRKRFNSHRIRKAKEEPKGFNYDIALIIAPLSALSYVILYLLKVGYFSYFNIPFNFITVDIVDSAGVLFIFFLFSLILAIFFLRKNKVNEYKKKSPKINKYIGKILKKIETKWWLYVLILFIIVIGFLFCLVIFTLIIRTFIPSIFHALCIALAILLIIYCLFFKQLVKEKFSTISILFTLLLSFTIGSCIFLVGFTYPLFKESYVFVSGGNLNEDKDYVLIGRYEESLIVSEVDLVENRVTRNFKIIETESNHEYNLTFYKEEVGRLHTGSVDFR
ncbi:hypothetical protein [Peribacillus frigoritolerans]|uniref:hypothetical protein n=1 Tax=Peribacillus frigoritolerans TaxID=450367 RepID=UPI0032E3E547